MEDATIEQALAFARTLRTKTIAEAIGSLMMAYEGMDLESAKTVIMVVEAERLATEV